MNPCKVLCVFVAVFIVGCGPSRPQADIERGRAAVMTALDSWKANEPPARLQSLPEPIDFPEELRKTHTLVAYAFGSIDASDDVIRYTITLTLKDKRGRQSDREVVYAVVLKTPVVVARDPYF